MIIIEKIEDCVDIFGWIGDNYWRETEKSKLFPSFPKLDTVEEKYDKKWLVLLTLHSMKEEKVNRKRAKKNFLSLLRSIGEAKKVR